MAVLYFSICFFGWGIAILLMTIIGKNLEHKTTLVCNLIGYLVVNVFILQKAKLGLTLHHGMAVFVGVLFVASNLAYYKLSEMGGQASVLGPLTGLYVLVPVVLGPVFLEEKLTPRAWVGIVFAVLAIYLLSSAGAAPAGSTGGEVT